MPTTPALIRLNRVFGCGGECSGTWLDCICSGRLGHIQFLVTQAEACEAAAADDFLEEIDV